MATREGVDYTTNERPSVASLVAAGKTFACRYGGPGGTWKQLTLAEADELRAAGIDIVANAEGTTGGLLLGYDAGYDWAQSADRHFRDCGMPLGRPIYLSADKDPSGFTATDWRNLDLAMDGAAAAIGRERVGIYGGYDVMKRYVGNRKAVWYWQTYAWSQGRVHPSIHIYQYANNVPMGGGVVDKNRTLVNDFGQWGANVTPDEIKAIAQGVWTAPDGKAVSQRVGGLFGDQDTIAYGTNGQPQTNAAKDARDEGFATMNAALEKVAEQVALLAVAVKQLNDKFDAAGGAGAAGAYDVEGTLTLRKPA